MRPPLFRAIAQFGWLDAALYALARLLAHVSGGAWGLYKYRFVAQAVAGRALCGPRGRAIAVRLCSTLAQLPHPYPRPAAVLAQRYAQGARSLAAVRDGELLGFIWLLQGSYLEDEVRARYRLAATGSNWDFDVWVRPDARGGLTFARLWDEANCLLRAEAVQWSCSRISAFNPVSLAAHARIGTRTLGGAIFLRCGNWQWMLASLAPFFHLSRGPGACPELRVDTSGLAAPTTPEPPWRISNKSKPS